jgi:haloalkane dehalogenase
MIATTIDKKPLPRPAWLPKTVWPFETIGVEVDGIQLAVTDVGQGPAMLFVHTGAWSFIWRDLMKCLAADFRCICFDAPGNGRSGPIPQSETTLELASRAAAGVIEKLELEHFTLVAHDLGGISGLAAVAKTPARVNGIVAMNTFGWRPSELGLRFMLALVGSGVIREIDVLTNFISRIGSSSFGIGRHLDEAGRRAFRAGTAKAARRAFHYYMQDARRCDALYEQIGIALAGPFATLPVLTIFGERNDPFHFQQRWKSLFPQAVQVVVPKGNHFPMCDAPGLVAQAIRSWHADKVNAR